MTSFARRLFISILSSLVFTHVHAAETKATSASEHDFNGWLEYSTYSAASKDQSGNAVYGKQYTVVVLRRAGDNDCFIIKIDPHAAASLNDNVSFGSSNIYHVTGHTIALSNIQKEFHDLIAAALAGKPQKKYNHATAIDVNNAYHYNISDNPCILSVIKIDKYSR